MNEAISCPIPQLGISSFPIEIFLLNEFKDFLDDLIRKTELAKSFKPRLYNYSDYLFVKLYATCTGDTIDEAAEYLNNKFKRILIEKKVFKEKIYKDKKRKRRIIPHQTDVDKFFRRLSESDVKMVLRAANDKFIDIINKKIIPRRSWTGMVDNSKYPYYGAIDEDKHINAPHLPGTKCAWFIQGVSIHSLNIHLFTDFHSLTKGVYRAKDVEPSFSWLIWEGINLKKVEFDREFYRASLVDDLNQIKLPCLFPTKKYKWVRHQMSNFLHDYNQDGVFGTIFSQTMNRYPHQKSAYVRMVIIGHNEESAHDIKKDFLLGKLTYKKAKSKLAAFFTTLKPWSNLKSWARYLTRQYKRRWNIETGFRMLNSMHETYRTTYYPVKLADMHIRGIIYNSWQAWRIYKIRDGEHHKKYTFKKFRRMFSDLLEEIMIDTIQKRL